MTLQRSHLFKHIKIQLTYISSFFSFLHQRLYLSQLSRGSTLNPNQVETHDNEEGPLPNSREWQAKWILPLPLNRLKRQIRPVRFQKSCHVLFLFFKLLKH